MFLIMNTELALPCDQQQPYLHKVWKKTNDIDLILFTNDTKINQNQESLEAWQKNSRAKAKKLELLHLHPRKKREASQEKKDRNTLKQSSLLLLLQPPSNVTQRLISWSGAPEEGEWASREEQMWRAWNNFQILEITAPKHNMCWSFFPAG